MYAQVKFQHMEPTFSRQTRSTEQMSEWIWKMDDTCFKQPDLGQVKSNFTAWTGLVQLPSLVEGLSLGMGAN